MEQVIVMVYGNIVALQAELEAMKWDNRIREMAGLDTFNYSAQDFFNKAEEIRAATADLFR